MASVESCSEHMYAIQRTQPSAMGLMKPNTLVHRIRERHVGLLLISWFPQDYCSGTWRHNGRGGVSNHQPHDCLLNRLFRRRSKKTSKFRVTGHCVGNSAVTGEFPAQIASNAENVSIWWRRHANLWYADLWISYIRDNSGYELSQSL